MFGTHQSISLAAFLLAGQILLVCYVFAGVQTTYVVVCASLQLWCSVPL